MAAATIMPASSPRARPTPDRTLPTLSAAKAPQLSATSPLATSQWVVSTATAAARTAPLVSIAPQRALQRHLADGSPSFRQPLELAPRPFASAAARVSAEAEHVAVSRVAVTGVEPEPLQRPAVTAAGPDVAVHAGAEGHVGAATGSAHGAAGGGQDLDELAARLYDRIRARLRDELLIDRERAGRVTDVR
jgi:hypothetical protein